MPIVLNPVANYGQSSSLRQDVATVRDRLDNVGQEVATGKRTDIYRAAGADATELLQLHAAFERQQAQIDADKALATRLDAMSSVMDSIRTLGEQVRTAAVNLTVTGSGDYGALKAASHTALEHMIGQLNTRHAGAALFAGVETASAALTGWTDADTGTGQVPRDLVAGIIGGGITDAADAAAKAADLEALFAGPDFEATFYNGAPQVDGAGNPVPRLSARIDAGVTLDFGVQANDGPLRDLYRGLAMFAAFDVSAIADGPAREAWIGAATDALSSGISGTIEMEARLGSQRNALDETLALLESRSDLYNAQINDLQSVDPYEAATRLADLETQLEASYLVTRRLADLSFLRYM
ncbi:flagellar hook-associated protein [Oceanicola granulosus HTCC2516]|uniref:Flagellar hook-associated protein n=1 Tax=Oceanicola granulosus (strain ATCC BAA-861 / DSM 15982 / KCTC 12143 / HTCC2516) TaxID=314256 RepID=Q2CGG7_OCEGH|nr:flagellin [Oceanicola granulosus]EAR51751.1 flagellar hook-associated protein [Oceanicola granulosus HTCC2516]